MPDCYVQYTIKNTDNTIQKQPAAESAAGHLSIVQDTVTDAVSLLIYIYVAKLILHI